MARPDEEKSSEMLSDLVAVVKKWTADGVNAESSAGQLFSFGCTLLVTLGVQAGNEAAARNSIIAAAMHVVSHSPREDIILAAKQALSTEIPS